MKAKEYIYIYYILYVSVFVYYVCSIFSHVFTGL